MRRLVIELYGKELENLKGQSSYRNIKSAELVQLLRHDQDEIVGIWRIALNDPGSNVEDCFKDDGVTIEASVLEREADGGEASLVFRRAKPQPGFFLGRGTSKPGGAYMVGFLFKDGRLRFTMVGTQKQVKEILDRAEGSGLKYRVVSLEDADFGTHAPINRLTSKQRRILTLAYELGYFEVPKKITANELAARLDLTDSTVVEHLGKAKKRLLGEILDKA